MIIDFDFHTEINNHVKMLSPCLSLILPRKDVVNHTGYTGFGISLEWWDYSAQVSASWKKG
jgi:hypothetical protein